MHNKKMWKPAFYLLVVLVLIVVGSYVFGIDGGLVGLGVLFAGGIVLFIFSPKGLSL